MAISNSRIDVRRLSDAMAERDAEREQVLHAFNDTAATYPEDRAIHRLFEEQVVRAPSAVAAIFDGERLTYTELNRKANRLARLLGKNAVTVGEYVPILMPRSVHMLVAQLAVLKVGAIYVPMDPKLPLERIQFMIDDSDARLVVTTSEAYGGPRTDRVRWIDSDAEIAGPNEFSEENLDLAVRVPLAAYLMYTSGSTGAPKGVIVAHKSVNKLAINNGYARIESSDCIAHCSNPAFDAATFEIWGALLNGASLLIVPEDAVLAAATFFAMLREHGVTMLFQTTALFNQRAVTMPEGFAGLRYLLFGGEAADPNAVARVLRDGAPQNLLNVYGPTETTTFATSQPIASVPEGSASLPIGRPISNTQVYILDQYLQPVRIGVPGEIYIGGAGVALGYRNRPALSAERFVADPFAKSASARLYRSGDLARWRSDGTIDFIGRNDQQVKLRGFRIELGEIETQLARHDAVNEAAVLVREDVPGEKRLVAYVTCGGSSAPAAEALRVHLRSRLPDYMIPTAFVVMERLPLTSNGKLDRRSLPAPSVDAYVSQEYQEPEGAIEPVMANIWQDLLSVERVGRRDNFFELGGHSLLIVKMLERLRLLGLSTDVRSVFTCATLADLAHATTGESQRHAAAPPNLIPPGCTAIEPEMLTLVELTTEQIDRVVRSVPGGARNVQDIYPLTPAQEGIVFHHDLAEQGGDIYVLPILLRAESRSMLDQFLRALQDVIDRHDVLRTAVLSDGSAQSLQVVCRHSQLAVEELALDVDSDPVEQLRELMSPARQKMDLRRAPLMRVRIAAEGRGSDGWYILLQLHHVMFDHESIERMFGEVAVIVAGNPSLLEDPRPFRDHVAQVKAQNMEADARAFFRGKLAAVDEPSAPFGMSDVYGDGTRTEKAYRLLEPELSKRVRRQARLAGVSAATLFHSAWAMVVSRTTACGDVIFGTMLLGRLQGSAGANRALGMFINTLPLRVCLSGATARDLVRLVQRELAELVNYEQASLAVAQACSGVAAGRGLFGSLLNYLHSALDIETGQPVVTTGIRVVSSNEWTNYPVTLSVYDRGEEFGVMAKTDRAIDPQRITQYLLTALGSLVTALETGSRSMAVTLPVLPDPERHQLIRSFNASDTPPAAKGLVHELFERQVELHPDTLAVVYQERSFTYLQLNSRANQLARYLRRSGVGPGDLVGICMERSLEMMVGLLAVLKAGGAYAPIDANHPSERVNYIVQSAGLATLLIQEDLRDKFADATAPRKNKRVISLDGDWQQIAKEDATNLAVKSPGLHGRSLAYVIHTSGTTGVPKGVMVEHANVIGLWHSLEQVYRQSAACQHVAVNAPLVFDASVKQIVQLLSGRTLFIVPQECRWDAASLLGFLEDNRIHEIDCTPSQLKSWTSLGMLSHAGSELRAVLVGGEAIDVPLWKDLGAARQIEFYNVYGPTECTVDATVAHVRLPQLQPHIGRPIANAQLYILDGDLQPLPAGVAGEIYIGGNGLARGYLHRPELTAERFVANPFNDGSNDRMYRSGDLGRWRADGTIEYLGRNDHQVKIRGVRIELGEIEAQLLKHPHVREAVVLAREDEPGEKRLVAYVTGRGEIEPSMQELRAHLTAVLPEYMVPRAIVVLSRLPVTRNGKVDRRALPAPAAESYRERTYEEPDGELEGIVAGIWQQLLHMDRVGRDDNFFELGGHSLLAMQVVARIRAELSLELSMRSLFEEPTVKGLASQLDTLRQMRLLEEIESGDSEVREFMAKIAALPEPEVEEWARELRKEMGQ